MCQIVLLTTDVLDIASHDICVSYCFSRPMCQILLLTIDVSDIASHDRCVKYCFSRPMCQILLLTTDVSDILRKVPFSRKDELFQQPM